MNTWILISALAFSPLYAEECETPRERSWQAKLFGAGALLIVVAGIAVICLDGGSSNHNAKPEENPCNKKHRCDKDDLLEEYPWIND